jgi:hypothetical protein
MSPQNETLRIMTPSMTQSMTMTPTQPMATVMTGAPLPDVMTPEATKEQNKQHLKNIVDLVTEGFAQKKLKPENFLENDMVLYSNEKITYLFKIINDLSVEERKKLRTHLENLTQTSIPITKWYTSTGAIVKVLIYLEIEFDESITHP